MSLRELIKNYSAKKIGKFITFFFSETSTKSFLYFQRKHDGQWFQKILPAEFHDHKMTNVEEKEIKEIFLKNFKTNVEKYEQSKAAV